MLLDLIKKRRSVRDYLKRPIAREHLLQCIEAARLAPSACNGQPWKFIIVDDAQLKNDMRQKAFRGMYAINKFAATAPALIVVISDKQKLLASVAGNIRGTQYYLLDVGIACEHLILQAAELGIGSCWIGWFDEKEVKKILQIPQNQKVDVVISLGYCAQIESEAKVRKSQEEITCFNLYK